MSMTTSPQPSVSAFFGNRFVQAILLSTLFLQIGIWVRNYAILLYVMDMTDGDAVAVSLISVAEFAPIFIFSFIGGAFADRWMPKRTMIWCDLLSGASVFAVLLAMSMGSWQIVFMATLFSSILSQFSQPSGMKLFKLHVPEQLIQMGMSMYQTIFAIFMILGPVIGTFVFQTFGIKTSIAITGTAFIISAGILTFLPADRREAKSHAAGNLKAEMLEGFSYVWNSKVLSKLGGAFVAAGLGLGLINPLMIFIVTERLGLAKENLQWFMIVSGAGMMIGGIAAMVLSKKISPQKLLAIGMTANAITLTIFGLSWEFWLTISMSLMSALFVPCIQIGINTMILQNTQESHLGRVNGIMNPLFMGSMVITMSVSGVLKEGIGLTPLYLFAAILFIVGVFVIAPLFKHQAPLLVRSPEAQELPEV